MIIQCKNISKKYPGTAQPAVQNLNITINEGEIVSLLGPSGCGKSTTLRIIAGFEVPDEGEIILAGKQVYGKGIWVPPEHRDVGMVFQDYALFPHLNVIKNITFGLKRTRDLNQRAKDLLKLANLDGLESKLPSELSGGQQQRVALIRALMRQPCIVLMDEPFSNLDASLREQLRVEIKSILKQTETTCLFVTHNQEEALTISDRIIVLNQGKIEQIGTPEEIYFHPKSLFVAKFVSQGNILEGICSGNTIKTEYFSLKVNNIHKNNGKKVNVIIRPRGLKPDPNGLIKGKIEDVQFKGESYECIVKLFSPQGATTNFKITVDVQTKIKPGIQQTFSIDENQITII
ncbi:hypothetical protein BBF96_10500 [Anoxybacter fermentans]|uniref:ABC-type quaternary amine transporter n=1 Tax=Anoxybacter fermentans TaxID=1323375 RepID=A0A3Q9HSZ5_9FIRM|nr:ABC transporter ATP-binding protein [Anoxybacter fermentans]AZR73777.1 hypothetical protein BBF96_10500 [Anoxybacter fermentans]